MAQAFRGFFAVLQRYKNFDDLGLFQFWSETPSEMMTRKQKVYLYLGLFPFVWPAVAINFFLLTLAWQRVGLQAMPPDYALLYAFPAAFPATYATMIWVLSLLGQARHKDGA